MEITGWLFCCAAIDTCIQILLKNYLLFNSRSYSPAETVDVPDAHAAKLITKGYAVVSNPSFYHGEQPTVSYVPTVEAQSAPKRKRSKAVS